MKISELRKKIDEVDAKLVELISERGELSARVGKLKKKTGKKIKDGKREKRVIDGALQLAGSKKGKNLHSSAITKLFSTLISDSRKIQAENRTVAAFQGEKGAYSDEAAMAYFGNCITLPCKTFKDAFDAVENGEADFAFMPIENSVEGQVSTVHDLLVEAPLTIVGESRFKVNHCLLALPGQKVEGIREVFSHPQALGQCREFIRKSMPKAREVSFYDTAGSAKMISEEQRQGAAAVASKTAGIRYGLEVLKEGIQDNASNTTRFLVLAKPAKNEAKNNNAKKAKANKTSVVFSLKNEPGALLSSMACFANRGINLSRIESRPSKKKPWEYLFFLDFEASAFKGRGKEALQELKKVSSFVKVLGCYEKESG